MEETGTNQTKPAKAPSATEEALRWFVRLRSGDASDQDRAQFQAWCAVYASRRDDVRKLTEIWSDLDEVRPLLSEDLDRVDGKRKTTIRWFTSSSQKLKGRYGVSAALLASLLMVIVGVWWSVGRTEITEYHTRKGEQRTVLLPDGTRMVLNTETAVTTEMSMLERTAVLHRGEALFVVTHDEKKPFRVEAGNGTVWDIGTQFTVRRDQQHVTVSVVEGAVVVQSAIGAAAATGQQQTLTAGEQLSYSRQGGLSSITTVDRAAVIAWTTGEIIFEQRSLGEAVQEIGRYHEGEIRVLDTRLSERKISGRFSVHDREAFLRAVKAATQAKLASVDGNVITLSE